MNKEMKRETLYSRFGGPVNLGMQFWKAQSSVPCIEMLSLLRLEPGGQRRPQMNSSFLELA